MSHGKAHNGDGKGDGDGYVGRTVHWEGESTNLDRVHRTDAIVSNALLRAAVESANDSIIITEAALDTPGPRIEYVNPAFTRMTGYGVDEVIGKTPRILQGPRTDRELLRRLRRDLASSKSFHGETVNYRKDGSEYYVEWRITPLTDDAGDVVKWVAIQRDVTPRVRAEQEREQLLERERSARELVERQSRLKDEFLATLSHELRTPLSAIVGWTHVLRQKQDPAEIARGLAVIHRNAKAQTQLIEDLLDMNRIILGQIRLDVQLVELGTIIEGAMESIRHAAEQKGVRLSRMIDPLAGPVSGDPARLQQVIWNLLANAVKFTPAGGQVEVVCERINCHVEISVTDSGVGIRPDFLPHVFDRFRQADATVARRFGGLGLGLAIVKSLVELHGGQVRAKSPGDGRGSTFVVHLPLPAAQQDGQSARPAATPDDLQDEVNCPYRLRGLRVMVVDDEQDARDLVQLILEDCEATVAAAGSVEDALRQMDEFRPDVLVSDIGMPVIDGYDFIRAVRKRSADRGGRVPALALTAFARSEDRRRALLAGFDMHVSKPIEPAEMLAAVGRLATRG